MNMNRLLLPALIATLLVVPADPVLATIEVPIPSYAWTVTYGRGEHDQGNSIVICSGNVLYVGGQFHGPVDFDPADDGEEVPHFHGGVWDAFLTSLLPDGSYGGQLYTYGGSGDPIWGGAESIRAVTVDGMNNIYITGEYGGEGSVVDFDHTDGIDEHVAGGHTDIFVTRINSDGSYGWTRTMGGSQFDAGRAISADHNGVYVTGYFMGTVDFDPTDGTDYHTGDPQFGNAYITRLNADGSYGWTRSFGGTQADPQSGRGIAVSPDGTIWVTGVLRGVSHVPGWGEVDAFGWDDVFIAQLDPNGDYLLFYTLGGPEHDNGNDIALDPEGNAYITGRFSQTMDLDPTDGTDVRTAIGGSNIYVIKLSSTGEYLWGYHAVKTDGTGNDWAASIAFDSMDQGVVFTGTFSGQVDFDPSEGEDIHTSSGAYGLFITELSIDGSYAWTHSLTCSGLKEPYGVAVDSHGNPVVTGVFMGTVHFDPLDQRTSVSGSPDAFALRLHKRDIPGGIEDQHHGDPSHHLVAMSYPNPFSSSNTLRYQLAERSAVKLAVHNILGQRVATLVDEELPAGFHLSEWEPEGATTGVYFYRIEATSLENVSNRWETIRSVVLVR